MLIWSLFQSLFEDIVIEILHFVTLVVTLVKCAPSLHIVTLVNLLC